MTAAAEHALRTALIETARELLRRGLVEGTSGNLSARLPDDPNRALLSPAATPYDTMRPEDLVVVDLDGRVESGRRAPTTEKALHLACLRAYPEIGAVIHCHALYCSMFAVARQPIPCVIEEFEIHVGGDVPVARYALTGSDALADAVVGHVADRGAVLMANHGLLTVGRDLAEAAKIASLVERTARIVHGARALGSPVPLPEATRARFAPLYRAARSRSR